VIPHDLRERFVGTDLHRHFGGENLR